MALFTVAEAYPRRVAIVSAVVVAATFLGVIVGKAGTQVAVAGTIQTMLSVVIVLALGDWARTRRQYAAAIEENARLQEAEREERSRRAVEDERERIARELHDIVTHHVSVIVIQTGAGLTALDRRPERVRPALEAIDRTSREALTDMRRMLGMLGDAPGAAGTADEVAGYLNQLTKEPVFNRYDAERYLLLASDLPGYTVRRRCARRERRRAKSSVTSPSSTRRPMSTSTCRMAGRKRSGRGAGCFVASCSA